MKVSLIERGVTSLLSVVASRNCCTSMLRPHAAIQTNQGMDQESSPDRRTLSALKVHHRAAHVQPAWATQGPPAEPESA